ncbi:MAG: penicillin-binding transpeptidase domain-containing protein, partial [Clostridium sp.]
VVKEIQEKYKVNPYNTPMMIYTNMDKEKQTAVNKIFSGETFNWENSYVQAGVAAVDVDTGKIIAIGNGRNRDVIDAYNFATDINRQIGSTAKPIVDYAPGMEYLNWSTYTIFNDSKYYYSSGQEIRNSDRGYMGNITLRTAIAQSRNIPALKAFQQVRDEIGLDAYQKFVESFGIETEDYFHEAHSIGAFNGSNPLAMAAAYAVFANGGYYYEPYTVNKIIYRDTGEVIEYESEGKRIISDSTAFMITDTLVTAVQSGLSSGAKLSGYNIAAKTGTTNYDEETIKKLGLPSDAIPDSWLIGYDSEISIGLWYGCEKASKTQYLKSTNAVVNRGKLFRAIAKEVLTKGNTFEVPDSVVKVAIEKGSNPAKLASESTPKSQIVYEYFKKGTEPTETSIKYSKLDNVSNLSGEYNVSDMSMTLSWSPTSSKDTDSEEYGALGYKIYKDNNYLAFTTETTYTILNLTDPEGTYKVVTSYKNFSDNASSGVTYTYKVQESNSFDAVLKHPSSTYSIGDTLATYDQNPSNADIIAYLNSEDITSEVTVSVTITDSNGTEVTSIDNTIASTYTVTYNVAYSKYSKTLSRTITIK